jgi:hypothetical protein
MMSPRPRLRFALVCGLLGVAASASAQSEWVLWIQDVATDTDLVPAHGMAWRRLARFDGKTSCYADASSRAEELARALRDVDRMVVERKIEVQRLGLGSDHLAVKSTFTEGLYAGARMWTFFRCLPDPIEPREAKGR